MPAAAKGRRRAGWVSILAVALSVSALAVDGAGASDAGSPDGAGAVTGAALSPLTTSQGVEAALTGLKAHAVAVGDVNGDGWVDVFVGTFADRPVAEYAVRGATGPAPDRLLLGGPAGFRLDGTFPSMWGRTSGAAFADLDGDGDLDLVVLRQPRAGTRSAEPSIALRNDGGRFVQVAVLDSTRGLRSAGVLDYDADGRLDLFLVEDRFSDGRSILLRNEGGFRFSDVTTAAGLPTDVHGLGVVAADLNGDTRTDLFVGGSNRLFLASGAGFRESAGTFSWNAYGDEDDVAGVAAGDVDNDGRLDLLVGQHYNSTLDDGRLVPARLYLNRGNDGSGDPVFSDVTALSGLAEFPTKAPHVELVDVDADGRLDIVATASAAGGGEPAILYNQGGSPPRFSVPAGLGSAQYWVAGATFDADRNGTRDVLVVEWDPAISSQLLAGPARRGNWLDVSVGPSGSAGVGAVVEAYRAGGLGSPGARLAMMPVTASVGYGSGSLSVAHLGVGAHSTVDVRIRMPNNGRVIDRRGVGVNRALEISAAAAGPPGSIAGGPAAGSIGAGIDFHIYPHPDYEAAPWSQWGQGIVLSDGRFVSAIGDHLGADGNSFIHVYDPRTGRLDTVGDVLSRVPHTPGLWGYGKVHGQMVQTSPSSVIFATYWGNRKGLTYTGTYQGDYLFRLDLPSLTIDPLGIPVPGKGIPSLAAHGGRVYGEALDPVTEAGTFFVYDPSSRTVTYREDDPLHDGFRAMAVMNDGSAYLATPDSRLLRYRPGVGVIGHGAVLPAGWLRAATVPDVDGTVYAVTRDPERFVAIRTNGTIVDLGPAPDYTTSLALDGDRVLFVPGAHGDAHEYGAALMAFETRTGAQQVIVELNPVAERELGLTLGGTYSVAVDSARRRAFVGFNAGPSRDDPWGEVVLAVVDLDEAGTVGDPVSPYPPGFCGPDVNPTPSPDEAAAAGYRILDRDGSVHAFSAPHHGDVLDRGGLPAGVEAVGIARTPTGAGYWIVDSSGTVHAFGDAVHHGDMAGRFLAADIIGIAAHPTLSGYWLLGADGGVFAFGAAQFHGSTGAAVLNAAVISMSVTADGNGYWLVAADGGVFAFGTAVFHGSTGHLRLNAPVMAMAVRPDGSGYWLTASDGGVFSFAVPFYGSIPGMGRCPSPVARAIVPTLTGRGYYALLDDGGIFTFGDAVFRGADPAAVTDPVAMLLHG